MILKNLEKLGWHSFFNPFVEPFLEQGFQIGRVAVENRGHYIVLKEKGEIRAEVAGKLLFVSDSPSELPKVGDWVALSSFDEDDLGIIHDILPRRTKLSRHVAGPKTEEQVMAANLDVVFVVTDTMNDFNLNRIERYAALIQSGGAEMAVIINKADLCDTPDVLIQQVQDIGIEDVFLVSCVEQTGMESLTHFLQPFKTYALVGSSGVGKSSIINFFLGEALLETSEIREKDAKGRHTTTRREIIALPNSSLLIDTPGMRELQLWDDGGGGMTFFSVFDTLANECHFRDCTHTVEKDCAVIQALERGELTEKRYENYLKLRKELAYLEEKKMAVGSYDKKKKWKAITKAVKTYKKIDPKGRNR